MKIKVYVVIWIGSYHDAIYEQVFGTKECAQAYINSQGHHVAEMYDIEECEVEVPDEVVGRSA